MKIIKTISLFLLLATSSIAQKNNVYVEVLGSGMSFSLNYEFMGISSSRETMFCLRGGVGFFEEYIMTPVHATFVLSTNAAVLFEIGGSVNFMQNSKFSNINPEEIKFATFPGAVFGIRVDPLGSPLVFRVTLTPFLDHKKEDGTYLFLGKADIPIVFWGGISLGVSF